MECNVSAPEGLTHLPLDKMAAISQTIFSNAFCEWKVCIVIKISLEFVPNGPINNTVLIKIMAWHRIGAKPLSEPMLTRVTDAYMRHQGEMS